MKDFSKEIETALDVLFALDYNLKKKDLLDKARIVYIQVSLFNIPILPSRKRRFLTLKHSLYGESPEICLFVPNRQTGVKYKKTTDELIDFCVDYYTDLLEKHKVKGITTVMPLKQLKSEYGPYELRRKLVRRFDLFLCKNSLLYNERFLGALGKIFRSANKEPLGVAFPAPDADFDPSFQKNIDRAVLTSSFFINPSSDNYCIPIGTLEHTKLELKDNLETVMRQISTENVIPGGFRNIRALYLKPSQLKPVPLYICPEKPRPWKVHVLPRGGKRPRGVAGELSTQPGKKVFVMANGDVFVTKMPREGKGKSGESDAEGDLEDDDESFDDGSGEEDDKGEAEEKEEEEEDDKDEVEWSREQS